jgi:hypothetical protein
MLPWNMVQNWDLTIEMLILLSKIRFWVYSTNNLMDVGVDLKMEYTHVYPQLMAISIGMIY